MSRPFAAAIVAGGMLSAWVHPLLAATPPQVAAAQSPAPPPAQASALSGQVTFNGLAVPGAQVTATRAVDGRTATTFSDSAGRYRFVGLDAGVWTVLAEMTGFRSASASVIVPSANDAPPLALAMKALAEIGAAPVEPVAAQTLPAAPPATSVIAGSSVNGAATPFAQPRAIGNNRPNISRVYSFALHTALGNSAWNARPYSFSTTAAPLPHYADGVIGGTIGGPLWIPGLIKYGPRISATYEHGAAHTATTQHVRVPTALERAGDFSASSLPSAPIVDPLTGRPFAGGVVPAARISPIAAALLQYYPLPNADDAGGFNYQAPLVSATTRDVLQVTGSRGIGQRTNVSAAVSYRHTRAAADNIFAFRDETRASALTLSANGTRQYGTRSLLRLRYDFTRSANDVRPFFADRLNVSGDAGITGNDQSPQNWGPPIVAFPSIATLSDASRQSMIAASQAVGGDLLIRSGPHNVTIGGDATWLRTSALAQTSPRGTLTFTGAATGNALADFLLGLPAASALASGSDDIQLRGRGYDVYANDDWRPTATLTINAGLRWEYETPFDETRGRLANLIASPGFASVQVETGAALLDPDRRSVEPRLGLSWRPSLSSSLVLKGSYGVYRNLGGYASLALLMAGQPPFARTFSVQSTTSAPLTLADAFPQAFSSATNTLAVDPHLRAASAQQWQMSAQRDLPASLTAIVVYAGAKGSHLLQAYAPNSYPAGAPAPCADCPTGFVALTSGGSSLRQSLQLTLRRRLYQGFTATVQYTLAKSTDDAATFNASVAGVSGLSVAQDWQHLDAERGPSPFDQRHLFTVQAQYTTGMGLTGGTLLDGWLGRLYKDWTIAANLSTGSGLPFTPIYFSIVPGTGIVGVRPQLTGQTTAGTDGTYANAAAFAAPPIGQWGDAGRNSLRGPRPFSLDATLMRTFRLSDRTSLDWVVVATNVFNRVTFTAVDVVVTSPQFGRPIAASPMRTLQLQARLRF